MNCRNLKLERPPEVISPNGKPGRPMGNHRIHWVSGGKSSLQMQSEAKLQQKRKTVGRGLPWFKQRWRPRVTQPLRAAPRSISVGQSSKATQNAQYPTQPSAMSHLKRGMKVNEKKKYLESPKYTSSSCSSILKKQTTQSKNGQQT